MIGLDPTPSYSRFSKLLLFTYTREYSISSLISKPSSAQLQHNTDGVQLEGGLVAEQEAAIERGVLLFKLLGNLHAPSDGVPDVRLTTTVRL